MLIFFFSNKCRGLHLGACFVNSKNVKTRGWKAGLEPDCYVCLFFHFEQSRAFKFYFVIGEFRAKEGSVARPLCVSEETL